MVPRWTVPHPFIQKHQTRKARSRRSSSLRRPLSIASGIQHLHRAARQLLPSSGRRALRSIHRSKRAEHGHGFGANERRAGKTPERTHGVGARGRCSEAEKERRTGKQERGAQGLLLKMASALQLLHLAASQLFPVLVAVASSPVSISLAVHLALQSEAVTKILPDSKT